MEYVFKSYSKVTEMHKVISFYESKFSLTFDK